MKIAQWKLPHGSVTVYEVTYSDGKEHTPEGWARISDVVEVEFPPLSDQELIRNQLAAIDEEERTARNAFQSALNRFKNRRANLQALTHAEVA